MCEKLSSSDCESAFTSGECMWRGACVPAHSPHWVIVLCIMCACTAHVVGSFSVYRAMQTLQVSLVITVANAGSMFLVWLLSIWVFPSERDWLLNPVTIIGACFIIGGIICLNLPNIYSAEVVGEV